ncbi:MAG TPA: polyhydroxyalkanoate synthesis repressor PhaR [Caulobacteraceae bacterium]|jgi:polyhydroxyalkanoate synthesis repressor PhaR
MTQTDPAGPEPTRGGGPDGRVVIKKYANRRLYNTATSSYVTLEHLAQMVREGVDFVVYDAKTNEDITRQVLGQIIFDEESRGQNLLPLQFLRQLIRFYGDSMQAFLPSYLELSLDSFARQQERMQTELGAGVGGRDALEFYQNQVRQNLALFDRAMKMFTPFPAAGAATPAPAASPAAREPVPSPSDTALAEMRTQLNQMQKRLEELAAKS